MTLDELNALDEKVESAISSPFVGEIAFTEEEQRQLAILCKDYFSKNYLTIDFKSAKYIFVLFTSLTQDLRNDENETQWLKHIFEKFSEYTGLSQEGLTNSFYRLMRGTDDRLGVFDLLENEGVIVFDSYSDGERIKRYYATFLCNALAPKQAMEKFFDYCYKTFWKFDISGLDDPEIFKNAIVKNFSRHYGTTIANHMNYGFPVSIRELSRQREDDFYTFFSRVVFQINNLLKSSNNNVSTSDNYLDNLILDWYKERKKEFASTIRTRKPNQLRFKPDVYYRMHDYGEVVIYITDFFLTDPSENIENGMGLTCYINTSSKSIKKPIHVNYDDPFFQTEPLEIPLDDIFGNSDLDNQDTLSTVSIAIFDGNNVLFNTETNLKSLHREYILFPQIKRGEAIREVTSSPQCGKYVLVCPNFDDIVISHPVSMRPSSIDTYSYLLYIFEANDGDYLETVDSHLFFFTKVKYEDPEFFKINFPATYRENNLDFGIINTSCVHLRLGLNDNIDDYGYVVDNYINNGLDKEIVVDKLARLSNCKSYVDGDSLIVEIPYDKECTPFVIKLASFEHPKFCLASQQFISIPGIQVEYPKELYLDDFANFDISINGEATRIQDDGTIPYHNGILSFGDLPLFECKIGGHEWMTMPKINRLWYYTEISNSASISFLPKSVDFDVFINGVLLHDKSQFGATIYDYENKHVDVVDVKIRYLINGQIKEQTLFQVTYKPKFISLPLTQVSDDNNKHYIYWNPDKEKFLGPKDKGTTFKVEIFDTNGNRVFQFPSLSFDKTLLCHETSNLPSGIYKVIIYAKNPFKLGESSDDQILESNVEFFGDTFSQDIKERDGNFRTVNVNPARKLVRERTAPKKINFTFTSCACKSKYGNLYFKLKAVYALADSKKVRGLPDGFYVGDLWVYLESGSPKLLSSNVIWWFLDYDGLNCVQMRRDIYNEPTHELLEPDSSGMDFYFCLKDYLLHGIKNDTTTYFPIECVRSYSTSACRSDGYVSDLINDEYLPEDFDDPEYDYK